MGFDDEVASGSWGRDRGCRATASARLALLSFDAGSDLIPAQELWYPSWTQKRHWRRLLKQAIKEHPVLIAEVVRARKAGGEWPGNWSEATKAQYLAGPWAHARSLQAAVDAKAEVHRAKRLRWLADNRDELQRYLHALDFSDLDGHKWLPRECVFEACKDVRAEIKSLAQEDWQDLPEAQYLSDELPAESILQGLWRYRDHWWRQYPS